MPVPTRAVLNAPAGCCGNQSAEGFDNQEQQRDRTSRRQGLPVALSFAETTARKAREPGGSLPAEVMRQAEHHPQRIDQELSLIHI